MLCTCDIDLQLQSGLQSYLQSVVDEMVRQISLKVREKSGNCIEYLVGTRLQYTPLHYLNNSRLPNAGDLFHMFHNLPGHEIISMVT